MKCIPQGAMDGGAEEFRDGLNADGSNGCTINKF